MTRKPDGGVLLDAAGVQRCLGVSEHVALATMRQLPKVVLPGVRKVYIRRADLLKLVDENVRAA